MRGNIARIRRDQGYESFGSSLDSTVTEEDIAAKEQELGFPLPEALRELYLTFNPEDPIFSGRRFS